MGDFGYASSCFEGYTYTMKYSIILKRFCPLQNFTHGGDYVQIYEKNMKGILSEGDFD
jgi:hypothetical protein